MPSTYNDYVLEMASLTQFNSADPFFIQQLPSCITYATDRIDRELNLLNTVSTYSLPLTAGSRQLDITASNINVLSDVNIITPSTQTVPDLGTRNPVVISDKSYLNTVYGSATQTQGIPTNFAFINNTTLIFGPWPNAAYTVELTGTLFPTYLAASPPTATSTFVTTHLWDLFIAASMIFMSGAVKNFGAQADSPGQAISWEQQYEKLRDSASIEDIRRKFQATGWTSQLPGPANPART
jgi:hypothetical protein